MRRTMNIAVWMGIFLIIIHSGGCTSSFFRERSSRDIDRRLMKFDSSNRYRILDKRKSLQANFWPLEIDADTSTTDSKYGPIASLSITKEAFETPKFFVRKDRDRRISMKEPKTSKSVIQFLSGLSNGVQTKKLDSNVDTSLTADKPIRIRHDTTIQRKFSNERKNRLSDDRRLNRMRENSSSRRLKFERESNNEGRMSNMRFRENEIRKTFSLIKWEVLDFSAPSSAHELGIFHRLTQLVVPNRFSYKARARNTVRQESNDVERFVRKGGQDSRNSPSLKFRDISMERNLDSRLQQPRYERHLLVPKRELKIPSEEVRNRATNSRRFRKGIRTNDISRENMEETADERRNGRGLKRTCDKRFDSSRRQSIEAPLRNRQNQRVSLESGRIRDQMQSRRIINSGMESRRIRNRQGTDELGFIRINREVSSIRNTASFLSRENGNSMHTRRNVRNFRSESSERIENRQRTESLGYRRKDREVSTRTFKTVLQPLENKDSNRKLRINELTSNRQQDKRFSRRIDNEFPKGQIRLNRERKLSNENRQLMMRASNKENIPNELSIRSRSIRNQDRAMETLEIRMRRSVQNESQRKQPNALSNERSTNQFRSRTNTERSVLTVLNRLRETRSRNTELRATNRHNGRKLNIETRRSISRLKTPLIERFVKFPDEIRISSNKNIINARSIIINSSGMKTNVQMKRFDENERNFIHANIPNANRRISLNQRSEQRTERIHLCTERDRRMRKEVKTLRNVDSRSRKFEPRVDAGLIQRNHRIRDEFKQSKLRVSSELAKVSAVRITAQTLKELVRLESERQQRFSIRSVSKHLISTPKLHSTAANSTSEKYNSAYSASKSRELVSSKKSIVFSDRTTKLHKSIDAPKSSSSNKSFNDYYEYLSEKRSSFISLILNVILGLAVIVASSDDKNKGFIPRRLTPFMDGFLKYTTVS